MDGLIFPLIDGPSWPLITCVSDSIERIWNWIVEKCLVCLKKSLVQKKCLCLPIFSTHGLHIANIKWLIISSKNGNFWTMERKLSISVVVFFQEKICIENFANKNIHCQFADNRFECRWHIDQKFAKHF